MDIQGPGALDGPRACQGKIIVNIPDRKAAEAAQDRVEISSQVLKKAEIDGLREKLEALPACRMDKIAELRELIRGDLFITPQRLEGTVDRLLEEIFKRSDV